MYCMLCFIFQSSKVDMGNTIMKSNVLVLMELGMGKIKLKKSIDKKALFLLISQVPCPLMAPF